MQIYRAANPLTLFIVITSNSNKLSCLQEKNNHLLTIEHLGLARRMKSLTGGCFDRAQQILYFNCF